MLTIHVDSVELYDSDKNEFFQTKPTTLVLEHSLLSVSKWEQKWHKAFMGATPKSPEEYLDYIRCMVITPQNPDPNIFLALSKENIEEIDAYINDPATSLSFIEPDSKRPPKEVLTNELIYYYMISLGIPVELCEKWHLNHLFALIKECSMKNQPQKKMSRAESAAYVERLNAMNRKRFHTRG
jgi:hypothetical protein